MSCNFAPRPAASRVDLLGRPAMTYVQYTVYIIYLQHFIRYLAISLRYNIVILDGYLHIVYRWEIIKT
jgi:hypothetical protein